MDIPLRIKYDPKGGKQAETAFSRLAQSSLATKVAIGALTAGLVQLGRASVSAALADSKAQAKLDQVLANAGYAQLTEQVNQYIDRTQKAIGITEDELRPAFITLFNTLQDVSAAQSFLTGAMDVAAGTGKDLQTVVDALVKGFNGQRRGLVALQLGLTKTQLETMSLADITDYAFKKFAGSAEAAADSVGGRADRLKISFDEFKESIGQSLINAFTDLDSQGGRSLENLQRDIETIANAIDTVISGTAKAIGFFEGLGRAVTMAFDPKTYTMGRQEYLDALAGRNSNTAGMPSEPPGAALIRIKRENEARTKAAIEAEKRLATQKAKTDKAAQTQQLARERAQKAAEARARAEAAADKAKQAALDELSMKFDIERINIVAAAQKTKDAEAQERLRALLILNTASYNAELVSIEEVMAALGKLGQYKQAQWMEEQRIIAENRRLQQQALAEHAQAIRDLTQEYIRMGNAAAAAASRGDLMKVAQQQATTAQAAYNQNNELFAGIEARFPGILQPGYTYGGTQAAPVNVQVQIGNQTIKDVVVSTVNEATRDGWKFLDGEWYR